MKRLITIALAAALAAVSITPALAHGSRHSTRRTSAYSVCSVDSCTLTGRHIHNGKYYAAHYYGDGHDYHGYCDVADCTLTGYHGHDGEYCFGHTYNDGHNYHGYCDVAGCTLTGYHGHDGEYCFGHTYNDGHSYHRTGRGHH